MISCFNNTTFIKCFNIQFNFSTNSVNVCIVGSKLNTLIDPELCSAVSDVKYLGLGLSILETKNINASVSETMLNLLERELFLPNGLRNDVNHIIVAHQYMTCCLKPRSFALTPNSLSCTK